LLPKREIEVDISREQFVKMAGLQNMILKSQIHGS